MTSLREPWAGTLTAGLAWTEDVERAIDRVAAGGFCGALGLALFYAKYKNDAKAYRAAQRTLERIVSRQYPLQDEAVRLAVAAQVMREYVWPFCKTCLGVGEVNNGKLRVVCHACDGSKVHRYSDRQRAHEMNLDADLVKSLEAAMTWLGDYVAKRDRQTNAMLAMQLRAE